MGEILMFYSVDRIEGTCAVCIGSAGAQRIINLDMIDGDVKEGSVIMLTVSGRFAVCPEETEALRKSFFIRFEDLFKPKS